MSFLVGPFCTSNAFANPRQIPAYISVMKCQLIIEAIKQTGTDRVIWVSGGESDDCPPTNWYSSRIPFKWVSQVEPFDGLRHILVFVPMDVHRVAFYPYYRRVLEHNLHCGIVF
jgi:hypothetical protein